MGKGKRAAPGILFALYCLIMLYLLFWQRGGYRLGQEYFKAIGENYNTVPFKTLHQLASLLRREGGWHDYLFRFAVLNLAGNVAVFVPLGILPPMLWPGLRHFWRFLLLAAAVILAVELTQLFTLLGICDIDDFILNMAGAFEAVHSSFFVNPCVNAPKGVLS